LSQKLLRIMHQAREQRPHCRFLGKSGIVHD
jgi:hypothetical protein